LNGLKSGKDKSLPWVMVHSVWVQEPPDSSGFAPRTEPPTDDPPHDIYDVTEAADVASTAFGTVLFVLALRRAYSSGPSHGDCCEL
jgi:hypothetical protein